MNARRALDVTSLRFFAWVSRKLGDPSVIERAFRQAVREVASDNDIDAGTLEVACRKKYADILPEIARR